MTKLDLQYDLVNYTPASASPVEANFTRTEQHINQELIERDGTVAMRAQLRLVGDPVNDLDAAPKQYVDQILPVGIIMMFGGTVAPPGGRWALCNGAELQSTDYPALFAILGVAYGGSAGRFNLPNMTDKFPRGAAPGAAGGSADAVIVSHHHTIDHTHSNGVTNWQNQNHQHPVNIVTDTQGQEHSHWMRGMGTANTGGGGVGEGMVADVTVTTFPAAFNTGPTGLYHAHNVVGGTANEVGGHDHNFQVPALSGGSGVTGVAATNTNLPPFLGVTYIIRVN